MIKQTLCSILALSLAGCAGFQSIDSKTNYKKPSIPVEKEKLYCSHCSDSDVDDYFTPVDGTKVATRYSLWLTSTSKYEENAGQIFPIFSLAILPGKIGETNYTITAELRDHNNGTQTQLEPVKISEGLWMGWPLLLLQPFFFPADDNGLNKAAPILLKQAANIIYNPELANSTKWECYSYKCHFNKAQNDKTTTAEQVLWIAENTKSFDDFQYVKNKLAKPLTKEQSCEATLSLIKNQTVSKKIQRYWALIDFFKDNCTITKGEIGMTKEQLINKKGIPSKGYFMNNDTEIISYSSLSSNGESVYTTTYTLDRDIVTSKK